VIEIPYTKYSLSRTTLGILVVSLDVAVVVSLLIAFQILGRFENIEN